MDFRPNGCNMPSLVFYFSLFMTDSKKLDRLQTCLKSFDLKFILPAIKV